MIFFLKDNTLNDKNIRMLPTKENCKLQNIRTDIQTYIQSVTVVIHNAINIFCTKHNQRH